MGNYDPEGAYRYRLRLESVTKRSCAVGGDALPSHTFRYYEDGHTVDGYPYFPNRLSKAIDHWGYYNGASANNREILNAPPTPVELTFSNVTYYDLVVGKADRNSNSAVATLGTIKEYHYPTGGHTAFTFESNTVADHPSPKRNRVPVGGFDLYNCHSTYAPEGFNDCNSQYDISETYTVLTQDDADNIKYHLQLPEARFEQRQGSAYLYVYDEGGTLVGTDDVDYDDDPVAHEYDRGERLLKDLLSSVVVGHTYTFRLTGHGTKGEVALIDYDLAYPNPRDQPVGGLRIQKIEQYEWAGAPPIVKTYRYGHDEFIPDQEGIGTQFVSSGTLTSVPLYRFKFAVNVRQENRNGTTFVGYDVTSAAKYPLADFEGNHLAYAEVTEIHPSAGSTQMLFDTRDPVNNSLGSYPSTPGAPDFLRGQMTSRVVYAQGNSSSTSGEVVQRDTFIRTQALIPAFKTTGGSPRVAYTFHNFILGRVDACGLTPDALGPLSNKYVLYGGYGELQEHATTTDGITTREKYGHVSVAGHRYLTRKDITNDHGHPAERIEYRYPEHFPDDPAYAAMEARNILTPVRTERRVGGEWVDGSRTFYDFFNGGDHPYPARFERYTATNNADESWNEGSWQPLSRISAYDDYGQPTRYRKEGWGEEAYTWTPAGRLTARSYTATTPDDGGQEQTLKLTTKYAYRNNNQSSLLERITAPDDQVTTFEYDDLLRLREQSSRGGEVVTTYTYDYAGAAISATKRNGVTATTTYTPPEDRQLRQLTQLTDRTTVQYFDGLGRPVQTVRQQHTDNTTPQDVATTTVYDERGRVARQYDPYPSSRSDGGFVAVPETYDHAYTTYYPDPLGRVYQTAHSAFNHPLTYTYGSNQEAVDHFPGAGTGASYATGSLFTTTVTDGNDHQTRTYTDTRGREVVTQRLGDDATLLSSVYRTYDLKDRLTTVYPPLNLGESPVAELLYQYEYDGWDNVTRRRVPDRPWVKIAYDRRNLPIAEKRSGLPAGFTHLATAYDGFGNVVRTGFASFGDAAAAVPMSMTLEDIAYNNLLSDLRYGTATGAARGQLISKSVRLLNGEWVPTTAEKLLNTTYIYDSYGRPKGSEENHLLDLTNPSAHSLTYTYDGADNLLRTVDAQTTVDGYAVTTTEETGYDHAGRVAQQYHQLTADGVPGVRQLITKSDYTVKDEVLARYLGGWEENGQLSYLQQVDYHYLGNGFLKRINNPNARGGDLFALALDYDQPTGGGTVAQLAGNIAAQRIVTASGVDHTFAYTYDGLDRLTAMQYADPTGVQGRYNATYGYDRRGNLSSLTREGCVAGNTQTIDDMVYSYTSGTNQLARVTDNAGHDDGFSAKLTGDYGYDSRGNTTRDIGNGTTVDYNYLDLPRTFTKPNGSKIHQVYTAEGRRVRQVEVDAEGSEVTHVDYLGAVEYHDGVFTFAHHAVGRVLPQDYQTYPGRLTVTQTHTGPQTVLAGTIESSGTVAAAAQVDYLADEYIELRPGFEVKAGGTFYAMVEPGVTGAYRYEYHLADHLGNNRILFADMNDDGAIDETEVLQENHYYPFGMEMEGPWTENNANAGNNGASTENRYRYNGKELNEALGLYDYGARWYDPATARWLQIDPLADQYAAYSPYNYTMNNPIRFIDPNGMYVEEGSRKEWDRQTKMVENRRDQLQSRSDKLHARAESKGWSQSKLDRKLGDVESRISSLTGTINTFAEVELSQQGYSLSSITGEVGDTRFDPSSGNIVIEFGTTSNFVHEVTHAGQFESGDIGFSSASGATYLQDVGDEVGAYSAQYSYDPNSVKGLQSSSAVTGLSSINSGWVQGITTSTGNKPYALGGTANTGTSPVDVNSSAGQMQRAYPHISGRLPSAGAIRDLKSNPFLPGRY